MLLKRALAQHFERSVADLGGWRLYGTRLLQLSVGTLWLVEIVKRSDDVKGFVVLGRRLF